MPMNANQYGRKPIEPSWIHMSANIAIQDFGPTY